MSIEKKESLTLWTDSESEEENVVIDIREKLLEVEMQTQIDLEKMSRKRDKTGVMSYIPPITHVLTHIQEGRSEVTVLSKTMELVSQIDLNKIMIEEISFLYSELEKMVKASETKTVESPGPKIDIWTFDGIPGSGKTSLVGRIEKVLASPAYAKYDYQTASEAVGNDEFSELLNTAYTTTDTRERTVAVYNIQKFVLMTFVLRMVIGWTKFQKKDVDALRSRKKLRQHILLADVSYESEKMYRLTNYKLGSLTKRQVSSLEILYNRGLSILRYFNLTRSTQRFFLTTPLETCKENVDTRDRKGEKGEGLNMDYLGILEGYFRKHMARSLTFLSDYDTSVIHIPFPKRSSWGVTASWICSSVLHFHRTKLVKIGKKMNEDRK